MKKNALLLKLVLFTVALLYLLVAPGYALDVTLAWDSVSAPDLAGYKIYYRSGLGGEGYDGIQALEGSSPIDVGNTTLYTLTGLNNAEDYFFVVTAYDTEGLESNYSNEVTTASITPGEAPTADAGPDQTVSEGVTVTLNGLNSVDPDDGIASYYWQQVSGPIVALVDPWSGKTTFLSPDVNTEGVSLSFKLIVTDYSGHQNSDICLINVAWLNEPPTADAGPDQTVNSGDTVTLDGSLSSGVDDGITSYFWQQIAGPMVFLSGATSAQSSFIAPDVKQEGEALVFVLTVTDSGNLQATDKCIVNIAGWVNEPPTADAGPDQTVNEGDFVSLNGLNSTDPEGAIAAYRWAQETGTPVTIADPAAAETYFLAPATTSEGENLIFSLTVTDKEDLQSNDRCNIFVNPVNSGGEDSGCDLTGYWNNLNRVWKGIRSKIQGSLTVENYGTKAASSFSVCIYLSTDGTFGENDILVRTYEVASLEANQVIVLDLRQINVAKGIETSSIYLIAHIDPANSVFESEETNNIAISDFPL